jgi:hypothetical protein
MKAQAVLLDLLACYPRLPELLQLKLHVTRRSFSKTIGIATIAPSSPAKRSRR